VVFWRARRHAGHFTYAPYATQTGEAVVFWRARRHAGHFTYALERRHRRRLGLDRQLPGLLEEELGELEEIDVVVHMEHADHPDLTL
jgi:hypothetical protein